MSSISLTWRPGPEAIIAAISAKAAATESALNELAQTNAGRGEAIMKENAPWTDQTGNARQGLSGRAYGLTIVLKHSVDYGGYLEDGTSKMAPRPIVQPTARTVAAEYTAGAIQVVQGLWG